MAFAIEFLIMVSVAEKKFRYCSLHWVDLAIILLPVIFLMTLVIREWAEVAPLARGFRLLRLSQLSRMGRVYRMQGLALKAWRAFLVLEVIQRLTGKTLDKQLKQLEELLLAKEEEVRELRTEIADLKRRMAAQDSVESRGSVVVEEGPTNAAGSAAAKIEIDTNGNRT
jgi:voltage-gated potassium channel